MWPWCHGSGNLRLFHRDSLLLGLRSWLKRSPTYVLLTFPRLLVFSLILCSTLPCTRCERLRPTLLFSRRCIHLRFLGSLQQGWSRLGPCPLPLLTVMAPPPWCLCRRSRRRRPLPLPLPSRVGSSGDAKVRHPFWWPPVANKRVPGRSPPNGVLPLLWVGGCLSAPWRHWQVFGAESWVLSILHADPASPSRPLLLPSLTPQYRFQRFRQDLLGHRLCTRRSHGCCPGTPWKSYSIRVSASPVVFSWWKKRRWAGVP